VSYDQSNLANVAFYQRKILERLTKIELKLDTLHKEHEIVRKLLISTPKNHATDSVDLTPQCPELEYLAA